MADKLIQKVEHMQVPAGYGVSAALTTTPAWMNAVQTWMDFGLVAVGVAVGLTTLWLNLIKIKKVKDEHKD